MKDRELVFIDSNVLVYSIYGTPEQKEKVEALLGTQMLLPIISIQVLKEFTNVSFKKKFHKTTEELKRHLTKTRQSFTVSEVTFETIVNALDLKEKYRYSFYDSLIIATALENDCTILYTEDLHHGPLIEKKLKVVNPFR